MGIGYVYYYDFIYFIVSLNVIGTLVSSTHRKHRGAHTDVITIYYYHHRRRYSYYYERCTMCCGEKTTRRKSCIQ